MWTHVASVTILATSASCGRISFAPHELDGAAAAPYLECLALEPALANVPSVGFIEPGLHVDGLRLIARPQEEAQAQATRASVDLKFGSFGPVAAFQPWVEDPAFVEIEGEVVGFGAVGAPRQLVICRSPSSTAACVPLELLDAATSTPITDDVDGPTVAFRGGDLVLAFSRGDAIYVARALTPDLISWMATQVELPASFEEADDPGLTPDGEILLFPTYGLDPGLKAMRWDPDLARYGEQLVVFSGASGSPTIRSAGADRIEVIMSVATRGVVEPHHALCTRG